MKSAKTFKRNQKSFKISYQPRQIPFNNSSIFSTFQKYSQHFRHFLNNSDIFSTCSKTCLNIQKPVQKPVSTSKNLSKNLSQHFWTHSTSKTCPKTCLNIFSNLSQHFGDFLNIENLSKNLSQHLKTCPKTCLNILTIFSTIGILLGFFAIFWILNNSMDSQNSVFYKYVFSTQSLCKV